PRPQLGVPAAAHRRDGQGADLPKRPAGGEVAARWRASRRLATLRKATPGDGMNRHFFTLFCLLGAAPALWADNWPGWRGSTGDGLTAEKDLPVRWSATENVRWKVPLQGAGVSAPVVWGDRVFLTSSDGR